MALDPSNSSSLEQLALKGLNDKGPEGLWHAAYLVKVLYVYDILAFKNLKTPIVLPAVKIIWHEVT